MSGLGEQTRQGPPIASDKERCCYMMVDSAMVASQNGFCSSYKLSYQKKTNIMQIMTKNITFFLLI
jgi:hypothetical protein